MWVNKTKKKIKLAQKFYTKRNWRSSKTGCNFPLFSSLATRKTSWHQVKFNIHHKQRYIYKLTEQIQHLTSLPIRVKISRGEVFVVGSSDETCGNQVCQWDGDIIKFRVPYCLETKYGKYVSIKIGNFDRNINRLPDSGAKTWHFYRKDSKWLATVQFTPSAVKQISRHSAYGCIGIDMNPGSIEWAYVDSDGNLKAHGQIPLIMGLRSGKQDAQIVNSCLHLAVLAQTYACPVVCENLDFTRKKDN